jgi:hypothetical protein
MPDPRAPSSAASAAHKPVVKTLQQVLSDQTADRKLLILGPGPEKLQDSRYSIAEAGADHVVIKLLGEEQLVIPYASILTVKIDRGQVTLRLR